MSLLSLYKFGLKKLFVNKRSQVKINHQLYYDKCFQRNSQKGVALLTVLLIVVVVSVLATIMLAKQQKHIKETGILLKQDDMQLAGMAGEAAALDLLQKDSKLNKTDGHSDVWAKKDHEIAAGTAKVIFNIVDISGRYNINNLHYADKVSKPQLAFFERLLNQMGLDKGLSQAMIDWQDADSDVTGKSGAEADLYAADSIIPANQDFYSLQELVKVKGITRNALQAMRPNIIAVPRYTRININSAPFTVMSALADGLDSQEVLAWIEARKEARPIEQVTDLFAQAPFNTLNQKQKQALEPMLDVKSNVFLITSKINLEGKEGYLYSYAFKHDGNIQVYEREYSSFANQPIK